MRLILGLVLICVSCVYLFSKESFRTWTSANGKSTTDARLVEFKGEKVQIEYRDKRIKDVSLSKFSKADQEYVRKVYGRSLFLVPKPFEGKENGAAIVTSITGDVFVVIQNFGRYSDKDPDPRPVIVGESIGPGSTLITGKSSRADLLLTNGTLAHLQENTRVVLNSLYQKKFRGSKVKANELEKEVSPSRTFLNLVQGELVVEVRKLNNESSFLIKTPLSHAGIRGTQFKLSAKASSSELAVLEGKVDFLDTKQDTQSVESGQKSSSMPNETAKLESLSVQEQDEINQIVSKTRQAAASVDLNRLANTVNGYSQEPIYKVRIALNMEMIWCQPGAFRTTGSFGRKPHPVILTRGFYVGKYEVTQEEYVKVMKTNPSELKGDRLPVLNTSFEQSLEFCAKLNKKERIPRGWEFTLPTLAEREYACRAGTTTNYYWGNAFDPKLANGMNSGFEQAIEVGSFPPNAWGFYDMHGNVTERVYENSGCEYEEGVLQIDPTQHKGMFPYMADAGGNWTMNIGSSGHMNGGGTQSIGGGFRVILRQVD
jgi:formylglycine-generating enzyme required for sulfatase activity